MGAYANFYSQEIMKNLFSILLLSLFGSVLLAQPTGKFGGGDADGYGRASTSGSFVLPLEWTELSVRQVDHAALIHWTTADEQAVDRFEVQRSLDGRIFQSIGSVRSLGTGSNSYLYRDDSAILAATRTFYYRIKQYDLDGVYTFSEQVVLTFRLVPLLSIRLGPNPGIDELSIRVEAAENAQVAATCIGPDGKIVFQKQLGLGQEEVVAVAQWAGGIYTWIFRVGAQQLTRSVLIVH